MKLLFLLLLLQSNLLAQSVKVFLVQLDPTQEVAPKDTWMATHDGQTVEYSLESDHALLNMNRYLSKENPIISGNCIDPLWDKCLEAEMKVIFREYTYVFGNHKASVLKFRNEAPYKPSGKLMAQDIMFTPSSLKALNELRDNVFSKSYAAHFEEQDTPALVAHSAAYQRKLLEQQNKTRKEKAAEDGWEDDFDLESFDEDLFGDIGLDLEIDLEETATTETGTATKEEKKVVKELESLDLGDELGFGLDDDLGLDLDDDFGVDDFGDFEDDDFNLDGFDDEDLFGDMDFDMDF